MKIVIDCRMFEESGIGVYLRGCLPHFLKSNNFFFLIGDNEKLKDFKSFSNVKIIHCLIKPFSLKDLFLSKNIIKEINNADIYYTPYINISNGIKIPVFTTIHDIVFPDFPQLTGKLGLLIRMWFYRRAYKLSHKIFTVSQFSKSRIEHHLGTEKNIIVTHSAIQSAFLDYRRSLKNIQKNDTIVFIGNIKKHKGLDYLLDAFILAKKEGLPHKLIIIGSKENFRSSDKNIFNKIESFENNEVSFTGNISNEELIEYLSKSALLVQPSLYEGFCLPPLEAMVLGTHALVSDIPVLKEIYENFPVTFFQAGNVSDLKEKLIKLLLNKPATVVSLPEHLALKYTFEKTSEIVLKNLII